jgi:hypothetical protein
VLSEQTHVDWLTKASTIQPYNLIGADLVQKVELERDSSETLIGYFTNVKSFRDKLRDSVITKELNEPLNVVATDSDEMNITLRYARHDMGTDIALPNISGLPFVDIGWDDRDISWDNKTWDLDTQASYDYKLEKIYSGLSGIPAESVGVILQGPTYTKYKSKENVGQELVKCYVGETNVLFDIMHHFDSTNQSIKVRTYYHNLAVRHVMLVDDKATMLHTDIDESTKVINLSPEELAKLPDATLETPGAIWINKERILYYVKTDTGITKLVRATAGTSMMNHAAGALIYPESGETVLPAFNHFGTNYTTGPYFSDAGSSLDDSNNGIVAILKNNAS